MHMKRALGTLTPWETFYRATQIKAEQFDELTIREGSEDSAPGSGEENDAVSK